MPLKDLLISFSNGSTSDTVLDYGLSLAERTGAALTAIHITPPILEHQQIVTWMPESLLKQVREANDDAPKMAKQALLDHLNKRKSDAEVHWTSVTGNVSERLAAAVRTHDLLVIGKFSETTEEAGAHVRCEQIVTQSGRPLIIVPASWNRRNSEHIVVAWDGGPTVARALFDAIQLLPEIKQIDIVSVAHSVDGAKQLKNVEKYVRSHALNVTSKILPQKGNVAGQVLSYCQDVEADMLVVGSRGSNRLRGGLVHGGTGRSFYEKAEIPVFVSQ